MKTRTSVTLAFLSIGLVPLAVVSLFAYYHTRQALMQGQLRHLHSVATMQKSRIRQISHSYQERLALLASRTRLRLLLERLQQAPDAAVQQQLTRIVQDAHAVLPAVQAIAVSTPTGRLVVSTHPEGLGAPGARPVASVVAGPGAHESFALDAAGRLMVTLASPLYRDSTLVGFLLVEMQATAYLEMVHDYAGLGATGETLLAERDAAGNARFLTPLRFDAHAAFTRTVDGQESAPIMQALGRQERLLPDAVDYRGEPVLAATAYIPEKDWGLVVKMDRAEALAPVARQGRVLLLLFGAAGLALGGVGLALGRKFSAVTVELQTEIEERKRAEDALQRNEAWFRNLAEGSVQGILIHRAFVPLFANQAGARIFGYETSEDIVGLDSVLILVAPHELDRLRHYTEARMRGEDVPTTFEWQGRRRDGGLIWVDSKVQLIDWDGGPALQATLYDITSRKQSEATLARYAGELARSNAELEQFAYVASHDLQEPLRMIASYTQLLARRYRGRLNADADEFMTYVIDGVARMQQLLKDLLAYSRAGTHGRTCEPTDCTAVLTSVLANLRLAIEESAAVVTYDALPTVMADPTQLAQLLQNLIGNAIKYRGPAPPRVHVSAVGQPGRWCFAVRDNGLGIDPQFAERIFVIFQRLHARHEYSGTGIGLAICKKIVERHGGQIWVDSAPGQGATFYFTLPAAAESQD